MSLFCSTDREDCCNDEFNSTAGDWFLPNGSKITASSNTQSLYVLFGNKTVGLNFNFSNISSELSTGIYHCEMMDRENITHHLYAGIYPEDQGI